MSVVNINRVTLTGNLTRDPELRATTSGTPVCSLRIGSTAQRKSRDGDGYEDKPNYFNVTVWGAQGENAAMHLAKGRPVAIDGRLDWKEWEDADGASHQTVDIVADTIQFLGSPTGADDSGQLAMDSQQSQRAPARRPGRSGPQRRYPRERTPVAA